MQKNAQIYTLVVQIGCRGISEKLSSFPIENPIMIERVLKDLDKYLSDNEGQVSSKKMAPIQKSNLEEEKK